MLQNDEISGFEAGIVRFAIASLFGQLDETIQSSEPIYFLGGQWAEMLEYHEAIREILLKWFDKEIDSSNIVEELPPILENMDEILSDSEEIIAGKYGIDESILSDAREEVLDVVKEFKEDMKP